MKNIETPKTQGPVVSTCFCNICLYTTIIYLAVFLDSSLISGSSLAFSLGKGTGSKRKDSDLTAEDVQHNISNHALEFKGPLERLGITLVKHLN